MASELKLPELGENIETGNVVKVLVSVGDEIQVEQPVLEIETDKATIEVPSSVSGRVQTISVKEGDTIKVGQVILTVEEEKKADEQAAAAAPTAEEKVAEKGGKPEPPAKAPQEKSPATARGADKAPAEKTAPVTTAPPPRPAPASREEKKPQTAPAPASPSVRRLARELGVEIDDVPGSGPDGRISEEDVKAYIRSQRPEGVRMTAGFPLPDFTRWGEVERRPLSNIRRKTGEHTSAAWSTIPHVTHHDKADISRLEKERQKFAARVEAQGGKLTLTAILIRVAAAALKVFPQFNSSLDSTTQELILKKYINIGVAVDTEHGLLVPVIRDADHKSVVQIAIELDQLAEKARNKKLSLDEMQGGTFTITNLGGIGGTHFSPIINSPEVAILGISRTTTEPGWAEDTWKPYLMLPLSLSYDHRVIDGADAARFLRWVALALENPLLLLLEV